MNSKINSREKEHYWKYYVQRNPKLHCRAIVTKANGIGENQVCPIWGTIGTQKQTQIPMAI